MRSKFTLVLSRGLERGVIGSSSPCQLRALSFFLAVAPPRKLQAQVGGPKMFLGPSGRPSGGRVNLVRWGTS